jgi:hypothetical protein
MLTLAELQKLASGMTGAQFVKQIGPIVLLQHPPGAPLLDGDERKRTAVLSKMAMVRKSTEIKYEIAKLTVALLPPLSARGGKLSVGRGPTNDLILEDPSASKEHATLDYHLGRCEILDLGSMNGTTVNAQMLQAHTPRMLRDGDVISFGGTQFVFYTSARMFDVLSGTV